MLKLAYCISYTVTSETRTLVLRKNEKTISGFRSRCRVVHHLAEPSALTFYLQLCTSNVVGSSAICRFGSRVLRRI